MELKLDSPVELFPGVGPARAAKLHKLGLWKAGDVLDYYPRQYEDRRQMSSISGAPEGQPVCIRAMVAQPPRLSRIRKGLELVKVRAVDAGGVLELTFFNQNYLKDSLHQGEEYVFYGIPEGSGSRRRMVNPVCERVGDGTVTGCIVPVYPLTAGITNRLMMGMTRRAVEECARERPETLPEEIRRAHGLVGLEAACRQIHFPDSFEKLELARRRLVFEELFYLAAGLALLKRRRSEGVGLALKRYPVEDYERLLPYPLTGAQRRVMEEVGRDLEGGRPMNRLVQGDVGSGKTAVAGYGAWLCAKNGCQCALMVPTELLAEQHFRSLSALLGPAGVRTALLIGSKRPAEKKALQEDIANGRFDLVVGTHALLSEGVSFPGLGLVVADEQHRFGVAQRAGLSAKAGGAAPHVLVMSATPIPRTLALIVYGDLEVSVVDELPPGRQAVETYLIGEDKRVRMYQFVRRLVSEGRQAYIVCPTVENGGAEEASAMELKAVTTYAAQLQETVFPDLRVGFVHGRMKAREKEVIMGAFTRGELDILVSTTVIEVGVDVPNAALMVIENAERFGLSQLHQLRGRVGRGRHQSYCVLVTKNRNPETRERLKTLTATTDGFKIAEEDLKLRGPGDFFGARQHGLPQLRVADLAGDMRLLKEAQEAAKKLLQRDPELSEPENQSVLNQVRRLFSENQDIFN